MLQTLLLDDEDPTRNTCPDELKQLISVTLLFLQKNSIEAELNRTQTNVDRKEREESEVSSCGRPMTQKLDLNASDCLIRTTLQTRNCSDSNFEADQSLNTLFNYFKVNFTIEAEFERCDVTVTALKSLVTDRFFIKNREDVQQYARITEKYTLREDDDEDEGQFKDIELKLDESETNKKVS